MAGRAEDLADRTVLDRLAGVHDHDVIAHLGHDAQIVGDEDQPDAGVVLEIFQQIEILRLNRDIEAGGRLIGDDHLRAGRQSNGPRDALPHTPGHLVGILPHTHLRRGDTHRGEQLTDPRLERCAAQMAVVVGGFSNLVLDGEERVQRRHWILQDHGDLVAAHRLHLLL